MNCSRCHGLMIAEDLIDIRESFLPMWMRGLRCVSCGNIVDPLILRNRVSQQSSAVRELKAEVPMPALYRHAKAA